MLRKIGPTPHNSTKNSLISWFAFEEHLMYETYYNKNEYSNQNQNSDDSTHK